MIQEAETLLERLHSRDVEFVIIGGICNVLHGVTLVTQDVDVCCRFSPANLWRLQDAVRYVSFEPSRNAVHGGISR